MNIYLVVTVIGLLIKLGVSYRLFYDFPERYRNMRPETMVFVTVFLLYSLVLMLLFGPERWSEALHLERIYVIRLYYFSDGLSLIAGGYLLVSMFSVKAHRHPLIILAIVLFVVVGGYFLIFTPSMVNGTRVGPGNIIFSAPADYVFYGRAIVYMCTAAVVVALFKTYREARSNHAQIKNVYALGAALVYSISCLIGVYKVFPMLMAVRGILFYVVVVVILQRSKFFDIRPATPATLEANTLREFSRAFRSYAAEESGHREALRRIERSMVAYKLEKITGFKDDKGSSLPQVASSMKINLSSLYDLLKRLELDKPDKKRKKKEAR